jgi:C2 domain-containing protein 3
VIVDNSFLKKVQNNHLELKLWERISSKSEKLVGSSRIPLHQFFIAFRDVLMIEHLSSNHLPIISIDACTNFFSPLSNELFCQGKVLMAIGSGSQIEHLKLAKNLNNLSVPIQANPEHTLPSHINMKNKLTEFIESLSQKLPEPENTYHKLKSPSSSQPQLKRTSDLLETLQLALSKSTKPLGTLKQEIAGSSESSTSLVLQEKRIRILIILEHALHLHKVVKKKQNRRKNKTNLTTSEFEPSSYATFDSSLEPQSFESNPLPENVVKSHEGFVYCSKVIKSVDPNWNQSFDVELPLDLLTNSEKRFIVKIWRKCSQEADMKPAPFEDAVIGFTAVDLSVLLTGLPILSGYYNIMDFAGRCNGQIKLTFKPFTNLVGYQNSLPISLSSPLNVDVSLSDDGSNLLSRTLKRKFTELDEITQRLKARLFDVTGDENFDPDEEFEKDLNTTVDEDMDDENSTGFEWLKNDSKQNHFNDLSSYKSELNNFLQLQPSTSKSGMGSFSTLPTQRLVSGCSNSPPSMDIDRLLNKYDLDTLINPNIFKPN